MSILEFVVWVHVDLLGERSALLVLSNNAGTFAVLFGILVADQELTILAISARCFPGDLDHLEDGSGSAENRVHLFKRTIGGLWVEEVDDRNNECVAVKICQLEDDILDRYSSGIA